MLIIFSSHRKFIFLSLDFFSLPCLLHSNPRKRDGNRPPPPPLFLPLPMTITYQFPHLCSKHTCTHMHAHTKKREMAIIVHLHRDCHAITIIPILSSIDDHLKHLCHDRAPLVLEVHCKGH